MLDSLTILFLLLVLLIYGLTAWHFLRLQSRALAAGVTFTVRDWIPMQLRKVPATAIVEARIAAAQEGVDGVTWANLEAHHLAGGNVPQLVEGLIAARRAGKSLDFDRACAIELVSRYSGTTLPEVVEKSVHAQVHSLEPVTAHTQDGSPVTATAEISVVVNLDRYIGGADLPVLSQRIQDFLTYCITNTASPQDPALDPGRLARAIKDGGLEANTAFDLVTLKIALD